MLSFNEYRDRTGLTGTGAIEIPETPEISTNIVNQINQIVDSWVSDLKKTLLDPTTYPNQRRGIWDRFKNSMSNMWHGRYNQTNPYFWKNKLGDDLGDNVDNVENQESFNPNNLSLTDYKELKDICESLEVQLNEDVPYGAQNLRIVGLIDKKAKELKQKLMSIVGQNADVSHAPDEPVAHTPMSYANEPEVQEEEPDTSDADAYHLFLPFIKSMLKSQKITPEQAKSYELQLKSNKESIRNKVTKELENIQNQSVAPKSSFSYKNKPVEEIPETPETPEPVQDVEKSVLFTPPSQGKNWNDLKLNVQAKWNAYGGGLSHESGTKIDSGYLNPLGIRKMPWILRIGDPRRIPLEKQKKDTGKSYWYDRLTKTGRWEMEDDPITSAAELHDKVQKAKSITVKTKNPRKRKSDAEEFKTKLDSPDFISKPAETPEEIPTETKPKFRTAPMRIPNQKTEIPQAPIEKTISKPIEKPPEIKTPIEKPPEIKTPIEKTPEEKSKFRVGRARNKEKLKDEISKIDDEETRNDLIRSLEDADKDQFDDIEKTVKDHLDSQEYLNNLNPDDIDVQF